MPRRPVVGMLLAAGRGSWFNAAGVTNKLLAPLPGGTPMAVQTARRLMQTSNDVAAVVPTVATHGAQVDRLAALLTEAGCEALHRPNAVRGVNVSLTTDVAAHPQVGGWVVALADMPRIAPGTIIQIANAMGPHGCAAPFHVGQRGHPIGFGADFFAGLTTLGGDEDVRQLIGPAKFISIEADDVGVLRGIDTPTDLAR